MTKPTNRDTFGNQPATRLSRRGLGGAFSFGRSRARRYNEEAEGENRVTFADVAGIGESRNELVESVTALEEAGRRR